MEKLSLAEAVAQIEETVRLFAEYENQRLKFEIERLIVLANDYCRLGGEIPVGLAFEISNVLIKSIEEFNKKQSITEGTGNLQKIKQDDTELQFFQVKTAEILADEIFESLKAKLKLYRRLAAW